MYHPFFSEIKKEELLWEDNPWQFLLWPCTVHSVVWQSILSAWKLLKAGVIRNGGILLRAVAL